MRTVVALLVVVGSGLSAIAQPMPRRPFPERAIPGELCPAPESATLLGGPPWIFAAAAAGDTLVTLDAIGLSRWSIPAPGAVPVLRGSWAVERGEQIGYDNVLLLNSRGLALAQTPAYQLFDVSGEGAPRPLSRPLTHSVASTLYRRGIDLSDRLICYVTSNFKLRLVDITDPVNPVDVEPVWPAGAGVQAACAFSGDYLVVSGWNVVRVYDVADLSHPVEIGSASLAGLGQHSPLKEVVASPTTALLLEGVGTSYGGYLEVVAVDLRDPTGPRVADATTRVAWTTVYDVDLHDDQAYVIAGDYDAFYTLQWVDFSSVEEPLLVARRDHPHGGLTLDVVGSTAYYATGEVVVLDVAADFAELGQTKVEGYAETLEVEGATAALAMGDAGVVVLDVSDLVAPVVVRRVPLPGGVYAEDLALRDGFAFVADSGGSLHIVDVREPAAAAVVASVAVTGKAYEVALDGDLAAVCNAGWSGTTGVDLVDVSDPLAPKLITRFDGGEPLRHSCGVDLEGGLLALGAGTRLTLLDVSAPEAPRLLSQTEITLDVNGVTAVELVGSMAVVGTVYHGMGVNLLDVTDPEHPTRVARYDEPLVANLELDDWRGAIIGWPFKVVSIGRSGALIGRELEPLRASYGAAFVGDRLLVSSGPYLETFSLGCGPPTAAFADSVSGRAVWLRDESAGWVEGRSWDFGDGSTSTQLDPYHLYADPGAYQLTLTVSSRYGTSTTSRSVVVGTTS